jgi:hypothetical protein
MSFARPLSKTEVVYEKPNDGGQHGPSFFGADVKAGSVVTVAPPALAVPVPDAVVAVVLVTIVLEALELLMLLIAPSAPYAIRR